MLSCRIPDLPPELFDPIRDKEKDISSPAFQRRCNVIDQFVSDATRDLEAGNGKNELFETVLDFIEKPTEEKTESSDLMSGLICMIYEGHLLESGFDKADFETALAMAEVHFDTDTEDGDGCFAIARKKAYGMDIYGAAFTVAQELINAVNKEALIGNPNLTSTPADGRLLH